MEAGGVQKPVGRPRVSIDQAKKLFSLQVLTAIRMARGESLRDALESAMSLLKWPDQRSAEHKRLAQRFRARLKSVATKNEKDVPDPN
jgi:hypothetical protein